MVFPLELSWPWLQQFFFLSFEKSINKSQHLIRSFCNDVTAQILKKMVKYLSWFINIMIVHNKFTRRQQNRRYNKHFLILNKTIIHLWQLFNPQLPIILLSGTLFEAVRFTLYLCIAHPFKPTLYWTLYKKKNLHIFFIISVNFLECQNEN